MNTQDLRTFLTVKNKGIFVFLLSAAVFFFALVSASFSEEGPPSRPKAKTVKVVRVKDNNAISTATILSKVKTKANEPFSQDVLNDDLKRLYSLGYFADVSIEVQDYEDGLMVIFIVKEKPLVEELVFTGNASIRSAKLEQEMVIKPGELLDENQLRKDITAIEKLYESRGFFRVGVNYDADVDKGANTAKLLVIVDEEQKTKIKRIYVDGNESFSDKKILKLISTKRDTLFSSGFYKEDEFAEDLEKIKSFYQNEGYLDIKVGHEFDYSPDKKQLYITLLVDEGRIYLVGEITITGNEVLSRDDLDESLELFTDDPFSDMGMRIDVMNMQQLYYNKGYILARVYPAPIVNEKTGRIDISYDVTENDLIYVNRINIQGNTKTKDVVIRRELRIYPGEPFDGSKIKRSRERLNNLGFFEEVSLDTEDSGEADKRDLVVSVKETKTGEFSFGGGYSSVDRFLGFIAVTQRNFDIFNFPTFTGDGQYLNIKAELGMVRSNYMLTWTEPWIFDYPLSFGFDLYRSGHDKKRSVGYGYEESRLGGDVRFGKEFTEEIRGDLIYKLEEVDISGIADEASSDLKDEEGDNILSTMALYGSFDTRDNVFSPGRGFIFNAGTEVAGGPFFGDKEFYKSVTSMSYFYNWLDKFIVLELKARAGIVNEYGDSDSVPIYERFYAGGANTIRGYRERSVSPTDAVTNDPIGGEAMLIGNVEVTIPVFKNVIKGAVFYDIGNVWGDIEDFASGGYKHGTGVGVRVKTPMGPLRVDWGYPLEDIKGQEQKGRFYFSMSREF